MTWKRIVSREGVDILSDSTIVDTFTDVVKSNDKMFLFDQYNNKTFTRISNVDFYPIGMKIFYERYFSIAKIKKEFVYGDNFLKRTIKEAKIWKLRLKDNKNLIDAFDKVCGEMGFVNDKFSVTPFITLESWQQHFDKTFDSLIRKNHLEDKKDILSLSIFQPWKKNAMQRIAIEKEKGVSASSILKRYQYLRSWSLIWYRDLDEKWLEEIKSQKNYSKLLSKKEILTLLKPNNKEKKMIELVPYLTSYKDFRDEVRRVHAYHWHFVFDKIARQFGADVFDLGYLTVDELRICIKRDKLDVKKINWRKKNEVLILKKGKHVIVLDKVPLTYKKIIGSLDSRKEIVKGIVANMGRVCGRVVIVNSTHDLKHVMQGDILIANTTHPDYASAMHRASAFVTNEGGVICHAAIVAREMGKPCIVGTKNATKVFRTGDMVEVDAMIGIVKNVKD